MSHKYAKTLFTPKVIEVQEEYGVKEIQNNFINSDMPREFFTEREIEFLAERDSFYMASVSENGWPYVQHRGGPRGFFNYLGDNKIGFADFRGNDQYMSVGNLRENNRVAIIALDYPNKRRLKFMGECQVVKVEDDPETVAKVAKPIQDNYGYPAQRAFIIKVHSFDWNCPQHITPRFTAEQIEEMLHLNPDPSQANYTIPTYQEVQNLADDLMPVEVCSTRKLAENILKFTLRPVEGYAIKPEAGSHIEIAVRGHDDDVKLNAYSLTNGPEDTDTFNIAILMETDGQCGSYFMHKTPRAGDILFIRPPKNDFPLNVSAKKSVLIAGGIGITAMLSMARMLKANDKDFEFHYAARTKDTMGFQKEVRQATDDKAQFYFSEEEQRSRLDLSALLAKWEEGTHVYVCGPKGMIQAVIDIAADNGWPKDQIHFEVFGNKHAKNDDDKAFQVELTKTGRTITVEKDQTLLDALLEEGLTVGYSCRRGECASCRVPVAGGAIDHRDVVLDKSEKEAGNVMCSCVSRPKDEFLKLDL